MTDDFGHEVTEARVLPLGAGGNIICGHAGYLREMAHRRQMNGKMTVNKTGSDFWDTPAWASLVVYFTKGEYVS